MHHGTQDGGRGREERPRIEFRAAAAAAASSISGPLVFLVCLFVVDTATRWTPLKLQLHQRPIQIPLFCQPSYTVKA